MTLAQIGSPFPVFTGLDGSPLDNGYVWIGVADLNPETNPIEVFYDAALTEPAPSGSPFRTSNGYIMRNGAPANLYVDGPFSVTVREKDRRLVIYAPDGFSAFAANALERNFVARADMLDAVAAGYAPPAGVVATAGGYSYVRTTGATAIPDLLGWLPFGDVTPQHFGAVGDGVANDRAPLLAFFGYLNQVGGKGIGYIPEGTYEFTGSLTFSVVCDLEINCHPQARLRGNASTGLLNWMLQFDCESTTPGAFRFVWRGGVIDNSQRENIPAEASGEGLRIREFETVNISGVLFDGGTDYLDGNADSGLVPLSCKNVFITNCVINAQSDEGIYSKGCERVTISNNTFIKCLDGFRFSDTGVSCITTHNHFIECRIGTLGSARAGGGPSRQVIISDNIFEKCFARAIDVRDLQDGDIITDNQINDFGYSLSGVRATGGDVWPAIIVYACDGTLISGNNFSFRDYAADGHVLIGLNKFDSDGVGGDIDTTNCTIIGNKLTAASGTISNAVNESLDGASTNRFYCNDFPASLISSNKYNVGSAAQIFDYGLITLDEGADFRRNINTNQGIRFEADASFSEWVGRSSPGDAKTMRIRSDANSGGLRILSQAGAVDADSASGALRVGRNVVTSLQVYRNATATVAHQLVAGVGSGAFLCQDNGGNATIGNASTGGAWNTSHLELGPFHLWVDTSNRLRIKNGAPTSATDGVVVGTQT